MTSVLRITFLTIGIILLKEIACDPSKKPKETKRLNSPRLSALPGELPTLPALPERPYLRSVPALPQIPYIPWLPTLPGKLPTLPTFPEWSNLPTLAALPKRPDLSWLPTLHGELPTLPPLPECSNLPERPNSPCLPTSTLTGELPTRPALPERPDLQTPPVTTTETPVTSTITATPGNEATTVGGDSTDSPKRCPDDQSVIIEKDLETITLTMIKDLKLVELLNDTFFAKAVSIKDVIKEDLQEFLAWFEDRPAHIKDLLEHLTSVRSKLEEIVIQKTEQLKEFTVLEVEYNYNLDTLNKTNKKIENYKRMCKLNCEESIEIMPTQPPRFARSLNLDLLEAGGVKDILIPTMKNGDKYFCSNFPDLFRRIKNMLLENLNTTIDNIKHEMTNDSKLYVEKVEELKKSLKFLALSKFGPVMYDILNLQDQYYHYDQLLKSDLYLHIEEIKVRISQFEKTNMDLELRAEKLRRYCFACHSPVLSLARAVNSRFKDVGTVEGTDLLDHVVTKLFTDVSTRAFADYKNIFNELELMFNAEWDYINDKVDTLSPIQEEIEKMTAQETEQLNKLKKAFPMNSNEKVIELQRKVIELNEKANVLDQELKKYKI